MNWNEEWSLKLWMQFYAKKPGEKFRTSICQLLDVICQCECTVITQVLNTLWRHHVKYGDLTCDYDNTRRTIIMHDGTTTMNDDQLCNCFYLFLRFIRQVKTVHQSGMQHHMNQSNAGSWHNPSYFAYSFVMFFILTVGFLGNTLTLLVLREREHRSRSITPLMMNLALADVFIIVFGYPIAIQANLRGQLLESSFCSWGGFINGAVGITSIFTLTEMSVMAYHGLKQVNASTRYSASQVACLIGTAWLYGILCMLPPLLGWNRFVVSASKISCCPDWAGKSAWDTAYNILLVILGFFVPLAAMIVYYYKIYR